MRGFFEKQNFDLIFNFDLVMRVLGNVHVVHMKVLHNVLHKCQHLVHDIVARRSAEPSRARHVQDMCKTCARHGQDMGALPEFARLK